MKRCYACGLEKDLTMFSKNRREKDGVHSSCKECKKQQDLEYRLKYSDKINKQRKEYRKNNRKKIVEAQKKSVEKNKEHYEDYFRKYAEENREEIRIRSAVYYALNKEVICEEQKIIRRKDPRSNMFRAAKARAKNQGVPFDIEISDIVIPETCPILLVPLSVGNKIVSINSPSLDKIIPELGYVKGNIQVISYKANLMKSNANPDQLVLFAKWILEFFQEKDSCLVKES